MSDIGSMVGELVAGGCSPEIAARVAAQIFVAGVLSADVRGQSADISAERRREKDRIRKQLVRGNPRISAEIRGQANGAYIIDKKEEDKKESKIGERNGSVRGQRLPDNWEPAEPEREFARNRGWSEQQIGTEALKFRNYWTAKGGQAATKTNWPRTWQNWVLNNYSGAGNEKPGSKIIQAADDLRRKIASFDGPASRDFPIRDGPGPAVAGLLSNGRCERS